MSARQDLPQKLAQGLDRFVQIQQPFHELDLEKTKRDLGLLEEGRKRGEKNLPPQDSKMFDDVEQKIITTIETKLHRDQQYFAEQLNACHQSMSSLDL